MLKLKTGKFDEHHLTVVYEVTHTRGGRNPTTLRQDIEIQQHLDRPMASAALRILDCEAPTAEEALDRMADWCERIAKAIRGRGEPRLAVLQYPMARRIDDIDAERIMRLILRMHDTGGVTLDMLRDACPARDIAHAFWERAHAFKAADGRDFAEVVIGLAQPEHAAEIRDVASRDDDAAYDMKRDAFFEVASDTLGWTGR